MERDNGGDVVAGLERVQSYFRAIPDLTWIQPGPSERTAQYVDSVRFPDTGRRLWGPWSSRPNTRPRESWRCRFPGRFEVRLASLHSCGLLMLESES